MEVFILIVFAISCLYFDQGQNILYTLIYVCLQALHIA